MLKIKIDDEEVNDNWLHGMRKTNSKDKQQIESTTTAKFDVSQKTQDKRQKSEEDALKDELLLCFDTAREAMQAVVDDLKGPESKADKKE
jgi:hypothetical protein